MAPTSKSASSKSLTKQSRSQDTSGGGGSPSSKSHTSSRAGGSRTHRGRSSNAAKSSLRETLSSFGDDVIKVKKHPGIYAYDNHGYFQPDIPLGNHGGDTAAQFQNSYLDTMDGGEGGGGGELAVIMSHHDPNFQTKSFEKVNPSEVGVRSSKWQKMFQASASSSRFQRLRRRRREGEDTSSGSSYLADFYGEEGRLECNPPYWGVSSRTRHKISFLSLSLILHELSCFTSCILLGCLIFQSMEAISWVQQKAFADNWILFKWSSSLQTILVVVTCLGFLNRVDTTELRSLWLFPLFLIPVLGLTVSDYCNKAWELQRMQCHSNIHLNDIGQHSREDCTILLSILRNGINRGNYSSLNDTLTRLKVSEVSLALSSARITELDIRGAAPIVMRILATTSVLVISTYLFCCRKSYYLMNLFGPPKELSGSLEENFNQELEKRSSSIYATPGDHFDDKVKVIFKRSDNE